MCQEAKIRSKNLPYKQTLKPIYTIRLSYAIFRSDVLEYYDWSRTYSYFSERINTRNYAFETTLHTSGRTIVYDSRIV